VLELPALNSGESRYEYFITLGLAAVNETTELESIAMPKFTVNFRLS
jgi:hypothetical protein